MSDESLHTLYLENRKHLELTGVKDVASFNEESVDVTCTMGRVIVRGNDIQVETLDLENGIVKINGAVCAIVYDDSPSQKGIFGRLFHS